MAAKFIQIAAAFDGSSDEPGDVLYALDATGAVWCFVGNGWEPCAMDRLPPAAAEEDDEPEGEEETE